MKKLMLTVAAAALAGGAFAVTNYGNIFDYKASVKYVDFKKVVATGDTGDKANVLVKTVKSATLTGYLVTPQCCPCEKVAVTTDGPCERFGKMPGFLVIQNKASKSYNKYFGLSDVKIMPANLLTEWWSTKSVANLKKGKNLDVMAQGYLFTGVGKRDVPDPVASPFYGLGDRGGVTTSDPHKYRTAATQFLFGFYNVVDNRGGETDFIEPFLDHSGFGKARLTWTGGGYTAGSPCVASKERDTQWEVCLSSLSGTLIGGNFDCAVNGVEAVRFYTTKWWSAGSSSVWAGCEDYICQGWDDHTENAQSTNSVNWKDQLHQPFANPYMYNVICGTWSIKVNYKFANGADHIDDVRTVAKTIDKNFDLATFDTPSSADLKGLETKFYDKWMADWD